MASKAEVAFKNYWDANYQGLFPLEAEYRFAPPRRWRLDFANLEYKLAIELMGFGYGHGGSRKSLSGDAEKHRQLALMGWVYFPIPSWEVTERVDVAAKPVIEWINTFTKVKIKEGW